MDKEPPSSHGSVSSRGLELVVVVGDTVNVVPLPARGAVTVGRDEECEVRIEHRSVSRRHAVLHLDPPLRIEDLGSVNGTFVRDTRPEVDTAGTHPLRRFSKETVEIAIGERVNLGFTSMVVRRAASSWHEDTIVRSPAMKALYEQIGRVAQTRMSVLVLGETGVGKDVLARTIHARSPRASGPFVDLHCAALAPSLIDAELFGYEKGTFTGAGQARPGFIESADGGTLFLDEVGEIPLAVQVKLLKVLEKREVLRIGARTPRRVDVRFVAATNRDLEKEIAQGNFREDLYHRLNGVDFVIPPLRERLEEIAPLTERFLAGACQQLDRAAPPRLSPRALDSLVRYAWPGNVRELRHVIERAAVLCDGDEISPEDLPAKITGGGGASSPAPARAPAPEEAAERRRIIDALEQCGGNQRRAAELLGMSNRKLVNLLGRYDIPRPRKPS